MSLRTLVSIATAATALSMAHAPHALAWEWLRSENAHVRDGNEALRAGDAQAAQAEYDRAAAELPSEPGVQLDRGLALLAQEAHATAREAFLRATEPPAPREIRAAAHYDAGLSFYREADAAATAGDHARARDLFGQAAEQFRQSLRQVPGNRDAGWNLELALRRETQEEEEQERQEQEQEQQRQEQEQQQDQQQDQQQEDQQQDQQQQDQQQDQQQQDQQQQDQQQQDQQQDSQQQEQQQGDQQGQPSQDSADQPDDQGQPEPQGGDSEQPGDQDEREEESSGTMERSLPPDQERVLDALQEGEENLERARARARGQRERRRPTQDW
jgi:Ca-activated chloride channel family protein